MIQSNELRIGNYVEHISFGIVPIEGIIRDSLKTIYKKNEFWDDFKFHKPIPLTEEWHNKFGITKNGFGNFVYEISKRQLILFSGDYVFLRDLERLDGKLSHLDNMCTLWNKDITKRDMFVNEWQNLYFALTNKELTNE